MERLIHIELAEKRVKRGCGECGKSHREWFGVEGTRDGLRGVDEIVRRWVGWGERRGSRGFVEGCDEEGGRGRGEAGVDWGLR